MAAPLVLFGISKWITWAIRPNRTEAGLAKEAEVSLPAVVSYSRLMELGPLLETATKPGVGLDVHLLLRFNLLNLGGDPATVCAIALRSNRDEALRCDVVPPVVVGAGATYPFMLEVGSALVSEAVDVQVERVTGERDWVSACSLPSP